MNLFARCLTTAALLAAATAPAADRYLLDPVHTFPSIEFPHMGISIWRGKFNRTQGEVLLDRKARQGTVDIVVDTASINFGLEAMDDKARSSEWFDVARFPTATYTGTIRFDGDAPAAIDGEITFRGIRKPLPLTINSFNCIPHPLTKKEVCGADAQGELNWSEWGMAYSEYGKGDAGRVTLRIQVEGQKQE
ncbi:YceI family protein [Fontimonas sp. SYSU GA230001]|uniref:YceI family protein n=1 Tax=Fontimonas sp. SYSU GA230001 TaxID=3142450 RepID=UPI0032B5A4B3